MVNVFWFRNNPEIPWKSRMLFKSVIARFMLKIIYVWQTVHVQGGTKELRTKRGNILKCISTYLYCTKYNEINIIHSDVRKLHLCKESHKRFLVYYDLCLKTTGSIFSIIFHVLLLLYYILMHFVTHILFKDITQCYFKVI